MLKEVLKIVDSIKLYQNKTGTVYYAECRLKDGFCDYSDTNLEGLLTKVL